MVNQPAPGASQRAKLSDSPHAGRARSFRRRRRLLSLLAALAASSSGAASAPGQAQPPEVTDASVELAVYRAVNWIKSRRQPAGHWEQDRSPQDRYWAGNTALALLALLYAGENPKQTEMSQSLEWLALQTPRSTYVRSLRAQALALVSGPRFRRQLQQDLEWLIKAPWPRGSPHFGGYDYVSVTAGKRGGWYDNSNSQFGVLGVWMATEAGASAADLDSYWLLVQDHWLLEQNADGGWSYKQGGQSTGSMTAAGLATLYIVLDRAHARSGHQRATGLIQAIQRGLNWMGREFAPDNPHGAQRWKYYYLYGVERAGRASGHKYFRDKDWFGHGAAHLLARQRPQGNWPGSGAAGELHNTCFALLFLAHGRAPLLLNKLAHGPDWDSKLRDAAGLTRYSQQVTERLLNWQIVPLSGPLRDLLEAPLLYLCGSSAWQFRDAEALKLRAYCQRGGMILAVAGQAGRQFSRSMEALAGRIFPEFPLRPVPDDHPLLNGQVQFPIAHPPLMYEVHNGLRTLMLICTADIARAWNRYQVRRREQDFHLGLNIYLYATDKTSFRSRLQSPAIPLQPVAVQRTVRLARLRHAGRWDIEPYGWLRLRNYLNNQAATRLLVTSGVACDALERAQFDAAYLSGYQAFELSARELAGLRRFITGGGTLLADAAGGSRAFLESFEHHLSEALKIEPRVLPADDPLLTGRGIPGAGRLSAIGYQRAARALAGRHPAPWLKGYRLERHWGVIYSPLDLSAALLGTPVYGCRGYDDDSARRIMRNLLMYARLSTAAKARLSQPAPQPPTGHRRAP